MQRLRPRMLSVQEDDMAEETTGGQQGVAGGAPTQQTAGKPVAPGQMAGDQVPPGTHPDMRPGDELPPGAPGGGENYCLVCGGSGRLADGSRCENCEGTGRVIESVSGGP